MKAGCLLGKYTPVAMSGTVLLIGALPKVPAIQCCCAFAVICAIAWNTFLKIIRHYL